jgi:asparagine synthase (glutamine-hydrolysing)
MCGFAGFFEPSSSRTEEQMNEAVRLMAETLHHRGPDDGGSWVDVSCGVALGFRRLSIIDLSPAGRQPMTSHNGRYVIVYNGEIYNHRDIRKELEVPWRGHSDTETLLEAISVWGVVKALEKAVGMFALALWDRKERELTLARDRLGEKPLYYGWNRSTFLFGSELKALRACSATSGERSWEIDRGALCLYLRHNYVPAPYSIYQGIHKLPAATFLRMKTSAGASRDIDPEYYWDIRKVAEKGIAAPFPGTEEEAVETLDAVLRAAVRQQMAADVPLGAFLSGGVDSSTVVALMQAQNNRPVKTFTIGFHEDDYNEAVYAKAVADHLGTDHTELYITPEQAQGVIPRLPYLYNEPFSDSSQIPTFLVSQMARSHVTVSLSGDGGDELFGGYNRYFWGPSIWKNISWIPLFWRQGMAKMITAFSPKTWDNFYKKTSSVRLERFKQRTIGDKLYKLAEIIPSKDLKSIYIKLVSGWQDPTTVVLAAEEPKTMITDPELWPDFTDFSQSMMLLDALTYLPDDILVKVDRASMGVSLEARVPLLDHRVVEFAWHLPLSMKIRNNQENSKWLLRKVLYRYVPRELIERPKTGFGVPIETWLRGPLRDWAESLLDERRLRQEGFFDPKPIREKWLEHLSGSRNWQYPLWYILMFQAWLETTRG